MVIVAAGNTILPIQYLRGIAAMMVVWHHTKAQIPAFDVFLPGSFGGAGVDIFFVISGFIMVITTERRHFTPQEFMVRRLIRVVPLYWILTIGMVAIWYIAPSLFKTLIVSPETLIKSLFFVPYFSDAFPEYIFPLLVPGWTINYEIFFYSLFSLTLFFKPHTGLFLLAASIAALIASAGIWGPFINPLAIFYTNPLILEFISGAGIAYIWLRNRTSVSENWGTIIFIMGWILILLSSFFSVSRYLTVLAASLVVYGSLLSKLTSFNSHKLKILGDATYAIYLTHIFSLGVVRIAWSNLQGNQAGAINAVIFAGLCMAFSAAVGIYVYSEIEKPITGFLNSKYSSALLQ